VSTISNCKLATLQLEFPIHVSEYHVSKVFFSVCLESVYCRSAFCCNVYLRGLRRGNSVDGYLKNACCDCVLHSVCVLTVHKYTDVLSLFVISGIFNNICLSC
jgi:hypothetical protein